MSQLMSKNLSIFVKSEPGLTKVLKLLLMSWLISELKFVNKLNWVRLFNEKTKDEVIAHLRLTG